MRKRVFGSIFLTALVTLLLTTGLLLLAVHAGLTNDMRQRLVTESSYLSAVDNIREELEKFGSVYADRLTLVAQDGTVLYDTKRGSYIVDVNGDIYAAQTDLPNHADRPEFQQAMANGSACITRESETLQLETHYYAVRIGAARGRGRREHLGPEHRHPAAAVRRSRADFARCHAVQLVADPPHGAAHQPSGRASGHD